MTPALGGTRGRGVVPMRGGVPGPVPRPMPGGEGGAPASGRPAGGIAGVLRTIWELLRERFLANMLFLLALVIGFLHGWLKMRYRYTIITFAYDIPMTLALILVLFQLKRTDRLFPDCRVSDGLKLLSGFSLLYFVLPLGVPWLVGVSALRGWCFAPLMMLLGYHLVRSVRQMEIFVWMVILMGTATAVYGVFFQTEAEIREMMALDPELEFRLRGTFYATKSGESEFRRFSTYVTAAVFGVTMSMCTTLAVARLLRTGVGLFERILLLGCGGMCGYAVLLTGSRTSLVLTMAGLGLTVAFRKGAARLMVVPLLLGGALFVGMVLSGSNKVERFGSLLNLNEVVGRVLIVLRPSIDMLLSYPLGGGLGRSGHGVPAVFYFLVRDFQGRQVDGDIGRLVVDMGICGLVVYSVLIYSGLSDCLRWMKQLRDSNLGVIAAPVGSIFILGLLQVFTGSPFLGIPAGMLIWILFGGLRRMVEEYERLAKTEGAAVEDLPQFVSFIQRTKMTGLFSDPVKRAPRFQTLGTAPSSKGGTRSRVRKLFSSEPRDRG